MNLSKSSSSEGYRPRVSAVSYLNTLPLVWGFLHGPEQGAVDLSFSVPAVCADKLAAGEADFGIVPCAELPRLNAMPLRDVGIACRGPVRSILLVSKVPPASIRTLAADSSSRTSVRLTRIVLEQRYGCRPEVMRAAPDLDGMLAGADAALIIGDPALHLDPAALPYHVLDLGQEWVEMTNLPMVFAVWAGRAELVTEAVAKLFRDSCAYGLTRLEEITAAATQRGFSAGLAREYLTKHIVFELEDRDLRGMDLFLQLSAKLS